MAKIKYKYRVRNKNTGKYLSNGKGTTTWSSASWALARIKGDRWTNYDPKDFVLEKLEMVVVETTEASILLQAEIDKARRAKELKEKKEAEKSRIRIHIQELCNCTVDQARTMIKSGIVVEPIQSRLKVLLKDFDNPKVNG